MCWCVGVLGSVSNTLLFEYTEGCLMQHLYSGRKQFLQWPKGGVSMREQEVNYGSPFCAGLQSRCILLIRNTDCIKAFLFKAAHELCATSNCYWKSLFYVSEAFFLVIILSLFLPVYLFFVTCKEKLPQEGIYCTVATKLCPFTSDWKHYSRYCKRCLYTIFPASSCLSLCIYEITTAGLRACLIDGFPSIN